MAGKPVGATARTESIRVRLTPAGMAAVDAARGAQTRSDYVRDALAEKTQRGRR